MGSQPWFGIVKARESQAIDEVVEASTELAKHRIGAIITFEQDANLDEFVGANKGHVLDAAVSSELLVSIFIPEGVNKLHDGSVIIRDLRIAKAGVFFPMPDSRVLDPSFGSRHRAALGITEETDAVVVVVSEERGTISFCFNGNIVGNLDGPGLRRALEGVFLPRRRRAKTAATKREPISQRLTETPSLAGRITEVGRPRVEATRVVPARVAPPEDNTLVSVPSEAGDAPTTRIRTEPDTETVGPPSQPPPAPLRRPKTEKSDKDVLLEPLPPPIVIPGAGLVPKQPPLTTPMRAPTSVRQPRPAPTTDPGVRTTTDDGQPDSNDGGAT
jgi:hypothetical protein